MTPDERAEMEELRTVIKDLQAQIDVLRSLAVHQLTVSLGLIGASLFDDPAKRNENIQSAIQATRHLTEQIDKLQQIRGLPGKGLLG